MIWDILAVAFAAVFVTGITAVLIWVAGKVSRDRL